MFREMGILQKKQKNLRTQQPGDRVTVTHCKGTWSFRATTSHHIHVPFQQIVLFEISMSSFFFQTNPESELWPYAVIHPDVPEKVLDLKG